MISEYQQHRQQILAHRTIEEGREYKMVWEDGSELWERSSQYIRPDLIHSYNSRLGRAGKNPTSKQEVAPSPY
ncbi:hypothetical protein CPB97_002198, partial [Podila verticillata]